MSDFSTISIGNGFSLLPTIARSCDYQSKDFPEHETETACIGGHIRDDGLFVRHDGLWNPCLNGWVGLLAEFSDHEWSVRFESGRAVEVQQGREYRRALPTAEDSPNDWRAIP